MKSLSSSRVSSNAGPLVPSHDKLTPLRYWRCFQGIMLREAYRFFQQTGRMLAALVRPLVWLFVFATGFRTVMGFPSTPPYASYVEYDVYITPGLLGMILLFNGMQTSLAMAYDREMGSMKTLLTSPLPRWYLLTCKLMAGTLLSILQCYVYLAIAGVWVYSRLGTFPLPPPEGLLTLFPALMLCGVMLGALGLFVSSVIKQLENFAGVMNFIIFPMFFTSTALYPLWRVQLSSEVMANVMYLNPFSHVVEFVRFALYAQFNPEAFAWVCAVGLVFLFLAIWGYDPRLGNLAKRPGA